MDNKVTAIIVAAGSGKRMNSDTKKQFMEINDKPLLYYSVRAFEESEVDDIVLVVPEEDIDYVKSEIVAKYGFNKVKAVTPGGITRTKSVEHGLLLALDAGHVLIHDGARPLITDTLINRVIDAVKTERAILVAVPAKETIYSTEDGMVSASLRRDRLYIAQTPQAFDTVLIKEAYNLAEKSATKGPATDDVTFVYNYLGVKAKIIEGDYKNIKVTTPEDIEIAKALLKNQ
ncbi:MAG: 2-C-methyl-D-erythritol 4-phosphate cytidylyltransferase [Lachnospiraceae bacterium]|nr:2-C-methyl-D-erythritol 4-phosphate cytidylyltransferase [Lachnospiraceae bacterium]